MCMSKDPQYEQECKNNETWLKYNSEPLADVIQKWKETARYRQKQFKEADLSQIIEQWPQYKYSFGPTLVINLMFYYFI